MDLLEKNVRNKTQPESYIYLHTYILKVINTYLDILHNNASTT